MSFLKKHWYIPAVALTVLFSVAGLYFIAASQQQTEPQRVYHLPENRVSQPTITKTESIPTETLKPQPVTIGAPDEMTREEMIAMRDELVDTVAGNKLVIEAKRQEIADLRRQLAESEIERAKNQQIQELHDWMMSNFKDKSRDLMPDLERDDILGTFAWIETHELWAEFVSRVSTLDADLQQQIMDSMRMQGYDDGADLLAYDLSNGGVQ